jgi:hypothetical protein
MCSGTDEHRTCEKQKHSKVTQFFTFGFGQGYDNGYVIIHGKSISHCREIMCQHYGPRWCTNYNSAEKAGVKRFGLWLVDEINGFDKEI